MHCVSSVCVCVRAYVTDALFRTENQENFQ